jgi:hypothetical protein
MDAVLAQRRAEHELLGAVLYLMCDDLPTTIKSLEARNVKCTELGEESWGIKTTGRLPSGGEIGLYQPRHETALPRKRTSEKPGLALPCCGGRRSGVGY